MNSYLLTTLNLKEAMGVDLRNHTVSSCGCLGKSKGEYYIEQLLIQNNISYCKEYTQLIQNKKLRFDFAITINNKIKYLIEFDGKQHFEQIKYFGGQDSFNQLQHNDIIKNQWCKDNNIPLIRIPYTQLKNLNINDLKLETSNFIIQ